MLTKLRIIALVLAASGVAAAITAAPTAVAASPRTCDDGGGFTMCQSPGNVEIHTEPQLQVPQIYGPFSSPNPFLFN